MRTSQQKPSRHLQPWTCLRQHCTAVSKPVLSAEPYLALCPASPTMALSLQLKPNHNVLSRSSRRSAPQTSPRHLLLSPTKRARRGRHPRKMSWTCSLPTIHRRPHLTMMQKETGQYGSLRHMAHHVHAAAPAAGKHARARQSTWQESTASHAVKPDATSARSSRTTNSSAFDASRM